MIVIHTCHLLHYFDATGIQALTSHPTASILEKPKEMLDQSTEYVQNRILPSVKDTWNAHLIDFAQNVNELDAEKIQKAAKDVKDKWL